MPVRAISGSSRFGLRVDLPTAEATETMGRFLAAHVRFPPQLLLLTGDLGAGKTVVARGFLRARCQNSRLRVNSPTYLLQQTYEDGGGRSVHHFDFYRALGAPTVAGVDWEAALRDVVLAEWPHPALPLPPSVLRVHLVLSPRGRAPGAADGGDLAEQETCEDEPRTAVVTVAGRGGATLAEGLLDSLVWRQWGLAADRVPLASLGDDLGGAAGAVTASSSTTSR